MAIPEPVLQKAINDEVRKPEGSPAAFARRLERNFLDLDKRQVVTESDLGPVLLPPVLGALNSIVVAQYDAYITRLVVPYATKLTGIKYQVGTTAAGSARAALYSTGKNGTGLLLSSASSGVNQSGIGNVDSLPFGWGGATGTPVRVTRGVYFISIQFSDATATFYGGNQYAGGALDTSPTSMTAPSTITPTTAVRGSHPVLFTY